MEISKITGAAVSQSNEVQLALASLNFDFALFKVEAPKEYQALGSSLTSSRKKNAETGPAHRIARKLDALLGSMIQPPELLVQAYGRRVSEISSSPSNPKGSRTDGIFRDHVGADSTTIWAAATSGKGALAVHLLACMLARLWTPAEATSIWVEIVQERKAQISRKCDPPEPSHYHLINASQHEITRAELASWDSGARAWLAIADNANLRQHTQLRLIIQNLSIDVNNKSVVFQSVIEAWRSSMAMVENILRGITQRVDDGAVLLALSAWHLYPDMDVFCEQNKTIKQHDPILAGAGRLIVGLEDADTSQSTGISWSLSLSHLRYYGDPVLCSRSLAQDAARVSFKQFTLVVLGCFLQRWCSWGEDGLEIKSVVDMIIALGRFVEYYATTFSINLHLPIEDWRSANVLTYLASGWISVLVEACMMFNDARQTDRRDFQNLVKLGMRRGGAFLSSLDGHPPRLFGLVDAGLVMDIVRDDVTSQLTAIRNIAADAPKLADRDIFAAYTYSCPRTGQSWIEYATVVAIGSKTNGSKHVRWIPYEFANLRNESWLRLGGDYRKCRKNDIHDLGEECRFYHPENMGIVGSDLVFTSFRNNPATALKSSPDVSFMNTRWGNIESADVGSCSKVRMGRIYKNNAIILFGTGVAMSDFNMTAKALAKALEDRLFEVTRLEQHLSQWIEKASPDYIRSMRAFDTAYQVYRTMPNATMSLSILQKELGKRKWVPTDDPEPDKPYEDDEDDEDDLVVVKRKIGGFERFNASRSEAFSCVALFETGTMDLSPNSFTAVMALSSGNSIFASASILSDPWEDPKPWVIQRLVANIGKPGFSMLIPPMNPRMKKAGFESWRIINHASFHGSMDNSFENTSIQLSFTGYESPVPGAVLHGAQDFEAKYVETLAQLNY